jgi:methionyl-tRNA formyltransferase
MGVNRKIVLWCGGAANQKALAAKIHKQFGLNGIVVDQKSAAPGKAEKKSLAKILNFLRFYKINQAWRKMLEFFNSKYPSWPDVPVLKLAAINSAEALEFTNKIEPDLVIVSGTGLIKEPLLSTPTKIGIINLHTGLSPYVKGGPNCTNWCIANGQWSLVGNTIMWINAGIDTGNIITTETIDIRKCRSLVEAHIKVMEHAHDLYLRAIHYLLNAGAPWQSVPQASIAKGNLFLTKMWTPDKKRLLLKNWGKRKSAAIDELPVTVPLPGTNKI